MKDLQKGLLIDTIMGFVMTAGVVALNWSTGHSFVHLLCDGFSAAGVLLAGMGGLKLVRNKGAFDMMAYGVTSVLHTAIPWTKSTNQLEGREESFADYQARKTEARKPAADLLISGAFFLVLAFIMLAIYMATEG